jgi:serine/threonine protein kinase
VQGMTDDSLISLQPGTVIAGKYEVVKCLGAGSMGLVYACRHRELSGHMVAVKVLFPEVAQDKVAAARFRNEILSSYGVSHPNVVRAFEYLRDGDLVAYAMEYVGGGDLAERLSNPSDKIEIHDCISLLGQMSSGVQAIHDAGIIHRDLKPENILITKQGQVKIADFGIARTGHGPKLTEHGGVVGTIDYVSPEYMLNSQVDWRSDIYALGILGYEMITGDSPFRGDSVYATMTKRLKSDPQPPHELRKECPKELDRIILKAMARDPNERYQSAAQMYYDLQQLENAQVLSNAGDVQVSKSQSIVYKGPVQKEATVEKEKIVPENDFLSSPNKVQLSSSRNNNNGHDLTSSDYYSEESEIQNPVIAGMAAQYNDEETIHEPIRMERVLMPRSNSGSGSWNEIPSEIQNNKIVLNSSTIDANRVQRLSHLVHKASRSVWVDVLILLMAVTIGIGAGFALLKFCWPELMGQHIVSN